MEKPLEGGASNFCCELDKSTESDVRSAASDFCAVDPGNHVAARSIRKKGLPKEAFFLLHEANAYGIVIAAPLAS
jgi:hypothetical protein